MRLALLTLVLAALLPAGDSTDPQSVCTARQQLRDTMPKSDAADRARMFRSFRAFYLETIQASAERFQTAMRPFAAEIMKWFENGQSFEDARKQIESRPGMRKAAAPWFDCGFTLSAAEGDLYPEQEPATLLEFVPRLPADLASYVRFRAREDAQPVGGDAALALSWEQLRERLSRWEAFAKANPQLPETTAEVQPAIHGLAGAWFFGEDNTPTYDGQTGRIVSDLVASWNRHATLDRNSRYQPLAAALVANLKRHQGQMTKDDRALFARFDLADDFDDWWRRYQAQMSQPR